MPAKKMIFVTGGTGKQGGAVARNLAHNGFSVKVLTRDPFSQKARELRKFGIKPVHGNLDNPESYRKYLQDAYGIFSVQTFDRGTDREIEQGKNLAELAFRFGIRHFVYSSVAGADAGSGIPHFESKKLIEDHIKDLELSYTILRPACFYENFLEPQVKKGILKGKLVQPIDRDTVLPYISTEDIGKVAVECFRHPELYLNRTLTLASEELSTQQVADLFTEELNMQVKYRKLPWLITRFVLGRDLDKMFAWLNKGHRLAIRDEIPGRNQLPETTSLRSWIAVNFPKKSTVRVELKYVKGQGSHERETAIGH